MSAESAPQKNRWRRRFFILLGAWALLTFLLSFPPVRAFVASPLVVNDEEAAGDAAYVMAGGPASWERLRAASDLYHWHRVPRIIVLDQQESSGYNFTLGRSQSRVERVIDYLALHGVPRDVITKVPQDLPATFGSLSEARAVARQEKDLKSIVVVTSAPHTRRSQLCFLRSMPEDVKVEVYSASETQHSAEIHWPIWVEYAKLVVYWFVA